MADQNPYVPTLQHPPPANIGSGFFFTGTGAPATSLGNNGDIYVDISTGDIYTKSGDTWTVFVGGSGGSAVVTSGSGSPVGVVTPTTVNQIHFDTASTPTRNAWRATGLASSDWEILF